MRAWSGLPLSRVESLIVQPMSPAGIAGAMGRGGGLAVVPAAALFQGGGKGVASGLPKLRSQPRHDSAPGPHAAILPPLHSHV